MSFTFVQQNEQSLEYLNTTTPPRACVLPFKSNVSAGHLIIVVVTMPTTGTAISDSQGNVYNKVGNADPGNYISMWWAIAKSSGPNTVTVNYNSSGAGWSCVGIAEWATAPTVSLDSYVINTGHADPVTVGTVPVTAGTAELCLFAYASNSGGENIVAGPGYTLRCAEFGGGYYPYGAFGLFSAENVSSAQNPTATQGTGASWGSIGVTFNSTGAQPATNLTAIKGNSKVTLNWNKSPDGATYNIYRSTTSGSEVKIQSGVTSTSYVDTTVSNGTTYYYQVSAVSSGAVESALSNEVNVTPSQYADTYFVSTGGTSLTAGQTDIFTFTPNGDSTATVTPTASGGSFSPPTITFDNTGAAQTTTFTAPNAGSGNVTVSFNNNGGLTNPSNIALTVSLPSVSAPTITFVLAGAVVLTCPIGTGGTPPYKVYQLQRSTDNINFTNVGTGGIQRNFTDSTVSASTTYYYRISITDSAGGTGFSSSVSVVTPSATAGNTVQFLPNEIAHVQSLAAANDSVQWQPFHNVMTGWLTHTIGAAGDADYEGSDLGTVANCALAYIALANSNPAAAQPYADKAIAGMLCGVTGLQRNFYQATQFLARGDGTTKTFTIPNADYVPSTLAVILNPVATVAVTKGAANGQDQMPQSVGTKVIKVSKTNDGTPDYVQDVDWRQNTNDYREDFIDWSLSQNQPTTGTTYYVTYTNLGTMPGGGYTVSGTTITFATAPSAGQAVFLEYVYGTHAADYSTLAYQQTTSGLGGISNVYVDSGYTSRNLQYVAWAYDWLWNYPGFSWALKAQIGSMLVKWSDWIRSYGYAVNSPTSNYDAGHTAMRHAIAIALKNREVINASRLQSEVTNHYTSCVQPLLLAPPSGTTGTNHGGHWSEGWNYGQLAVQNTITAAISASEAGFYNPTDIQSWCNDVMRALLIQQSAKSIILDMGDGYAYPKAFPGKDLLYMLAYFGTDATLKSYINWAIQNYGGGQTGDVYDLLYRNPSATAVNWGSNLPSAYKFDGTGIVVTRKAWDYASSWIAFHAGNLTGADHQPYGQGSFEIWRGGDDLIPLVEAMTGVQGIQPKSTCGSGIVIDDAGAGYMTYPSTNGGPAMGIWYSPPNGCQITKFEDNGSYTYWSADYGAAYGKNYNGTPNPTTELNRSQLFIRNGNGNDYFVTHDRITTVQASFLKQFQFPINPASNVTQNGTTLSIIRNSSALFVEVFADVPLTPNLVTVSINNTNDCKIFAAKPTNNTNAKMRYRTAMQISPSTVTTPDKMTDIPSTDSISEGIMVGNTIVMFGANGLISNNGISYTHTAASGVVVNHYFTDLLPNTTYVVSGANQTSVTTTAQGVAYYTTTGTGSAQTVQLATGEIGRATGDSSAVGVGNSLVVTTGQAIGDSAAGGQSVVAITDKSVGQAIGDSAANGIAVSVISSIGKVTGNSSANGVSTFTTTIESVGQAVGDSSASGVGNQEIASSYYLTGPNEGPPLQPSGNFTITPPANLTKPVIVTPNDNNAGGTFNPVSVVIYDSEVNFTYTPPMGGSFTIGTTNNGGLTNPPAINYLSRQTPYPCIVFEVTLSGELQNAAIQVPGVSGNLYNGNKFVLSGIEAKYVQMAYGSQNLVKVLSVS